MKRAGRIIHALVLVSAIGLPVATAPAAFGQGGCDPNNGIGPDGGLPALPAPTAPDAWYIDLPESASPMDMALDPGADRLYVVERAAGDVVALDIAGDPPGVVASVPVGARPQAIALDPQGRRLLVANGAACSVSIIDLAGDEPAVIATLEAGSGPRAIALDAATGQAWVANYSGDTISTISGWVAMLTDELAVGPGHVAAAFDAATGSLVLVTEDGRVDVWDPETGGSRGTVAVGGQPTDAAADGAGRVYVTDLEGGSVTAVDISGDARVVAATSDFVAATPYDIDVDARSGAVIVTSQAGGVLFLDPNTLDVLGAVPSTPVLASAAFDDDAGRMWMIDYTYHRVWSVPAVAPEIPSSEQSPSAAP